MEPPLLAEGKDRSFVYTLKSVMSQDPVSNEIELTRKIYTDFLTSYVRIIEEAEAEEAEGEAEAEAEGGSASAAGGAALALATTATTAAAPQRLAFGTMFPIENRRLSSGVVRAVDVAALRNYFSKHNTVQGESFFDRVNDFLFYVMI